jgi:NAD(P)-dependent dehydrogenase (short-subunit alcohol dehydrogenase family)
MKTARGCCFEFAEKRVLVTGASSGIGAAIAVELSRHGARLILSGRDHGRLTRTLDQLEHADHQILPIDLRDPSGIFDAVTSLRQMVGPLYGLCHSAGVVESRPLSSNSVNVVQAILDVNLIAALELTRAVCHRSVMEEGGGSVLFISSAYAHVGMPAQSAYSASKGAICAVVRALAVELARRRIRVNSISPGLVETDMTRKSFTLLSREQVERLRNAHPLGVGTPTDVAKAAVFLLAPENRWISGIDLRVDGGFSVQ